MSLLPQRKKSSEEIAKLRQSLGIPGFVPDGEPAPSTNPSTTPVSAPASHDPRNLAGGQVIPHAETLPISPPPAAAHREPKPVHSLKRSERIPILPPREPQSVEADATLLVPPVLTLKPVRSLRKSEQIPLPVMPHAEPPRDSNLPQHRHDDLELAEIRRREALALLVPVANPKLAAAHPALIIPGYLIALAGSSPAALDVCSVVFFPPLDAAHLTAAPWFAFPSLPLTIPACCAAVSLLIALFIALKKPLSRHHAAYIAVITLFVIVFGALHSFPQLRNAT